MRAITLLLPLAVTTLCGQVADEAFLRGDPVQVMVACANRAETLKPNNSRLIAEHARVCFAAGDRARAEALLDAAEASDHFDQTTYRLIADAWLRTGNQAPVLELLKRAEEYQNKYRDPAAYEFALVMLEHGMVDEARRTMARAFEQRPDWENTVDFARACLRKGLRQDAAEWFAKAVKVHKHEERAWHQVALALAEGSRGASAPPAPLSIPREVTADFFMQDAGSVMIACTDAFRPKKDHEANQLAEDGLVHLMAGDRPGAEACFRQAIQEDAEDGSVYRTIGSAWLRSGHHAEALAVYAEMERKDPKNGFSFMKAAIDLLKADEEAAASALMEKGTLMDPTNWAWPGDFAKVALAQGKQDLAVRWFARELAVAPTDWSAWNDVALGQADLRLKGSQVPSPAQPTPHKLWFAAPLHLDAPDAKQGSAALAFAALYPDRAAFAAEVIQKVKVALPSAELMGEASPAPGDRLITLETFQAASGLRTDGKHSAAYEEAAFTLQLKDGQGHLLRSLTFRDATEPGRAADIPQVDLAGPSKRPKPMQFKDAIDAACRRLAAFLASPALDAWID